MRFQSDSVISVSKQEKDSNCNFVFQRQQTSQEQLLSKIIIQSRLDSLRVVQEDKTIRLTEGVNKEGFFFFLREKVEYLTNMVILLGSLNFLTGKD